MGILPPILAYQKALCMILRVSHVFGKSQIEQ